MQTIYIDVLFLLNFFIDYIIIITTAFVCGREHNFKRIIAASAVGALYSVAVFFPQLKVLNILLLKFTMSILITVISFKFLSLRSHIKIFISYYFINFVYGGGIYAFYRFTNLGSKMNYSNGEYYIDIPLFLIIILTFSIYFLTRFLIVSLNNKPKKITKIRIYHHNKYTDANAIVDTGNNLLDPISMLPVTLVENNVISKIIGQEITDETFKANKMRIIPWKDASGDSKSIYAFKPSKIVNTENGAELNEMLIGIVQNNLTADKSYQALLHSSTAEKR